MNISFENPDKVNGLLTVTVEEADYKDNVEKTLKDYRKKANIPGFRRGMVPMGMIRRQLEPSVKMDAINKLVGEQIYKYVQDNKIQMLGEPLASDKQVPQDMEKPAPYTFMFDIAVAPDFKVTLTGRDKIPYYNITVDDKLVDQQVQSYAGRYGSYVTADVYDAEQRDMLRGHLRELDTEGKPLEGGIDVKDALIMPQYISVDDQKKLFDGAKMGQAVVFSPRKAYPDNDGEVANLLKIEKEQVKDHEGDFSYEVTGISRFKAADVDQKLFDNVFGKDQVKSEQEFRDKITAELKGQFAQDSDFRFLQDVREHCMKKVGKLEWPDALLKRIMVAADKDKSMENVEKQYDTSIKELEWSLIRDQLVAANQLKVENDDVREAAKEATRAQFAQYGMGNVADEYIEKYADEMMKKREDLTPLVNRAIDKKLTEVLKKVVKLDEKPISYDDFGKLLNQ